MGGDGGVKATQRRFMRGYKNPEEHESGKNIREEQRVKSRSCGFTSKPLKEPIVICELGNLFNKEDILTALIDKTLNPNFSHIKGLKDLKTLKLTHNPTQDSSESSYICPITGDEFNGIIPFCAIWTTGYVISYRAVREMGIERLQDEYGPFSTSDIIHINPSVEEVEILKVNMNNRRAVRANNKESKRKRDKLDTEKSDNTDVIPSSTITQQRMIQSHSSTLPNHLSSSSSSSSILVPSTTTTDIESLPPNKLSIVSNVVKSVQQQIQQQSNTSHVYKNLFHSSGDKNVDKKDRDLFMSVAGFRYTLS